MKKDFLIPERFSVLSILLTLVNEFVKLLTLHVLLIWFGHCAGIDSICPSSSSLYHALAPGSWFVWLHKWAFLPSGFWLRPVDGGHCQQMKERKEGEVTHGTFFTFSLWDFCSLVASSHRRSQLASNSPLCRSFCCPFPLLPFLHCPWAVSGPAVPSPASSTLPCDFLTAFLRYVKSLY